MNAEAPKDALNLPRADYAAVPFRNFPPIRWLTVDGCARTGVLLPTPADHGYAMAFDHLRGEFQILRDEQIEFNVPKDDSGNPR